MRGIEAIVFDCFGVLYVDESEVYFSRFPEHARELSDLKLACDRGFISHQEYLEKVSKITGESLAAVVAAFRHERVINQPLIDYMRRELGPRYKIGLLSNIGRGWIHNYFDEATLHELFDVVVLSGNEGIAKPEVEIFRRTAQRLGLSPEACLMIDDREENCQAAFAAGMQALRYTTFQELREHLRP